MDASLRVGAALIGLLLVLAFLQSASRVALVNRQRGDWLARRVGWLVHTTLGRLARTQQKYENVQDIRISFFNCRKAMKRTALSGGANASTAYPAGKPDTKQKAFATQCSLISSFGGD